MYAAPPTAPTPATSSGPLGGSLTPNHTSSAIGALQPPVALPAAAPVPVPVAAPAPLPAVTPLPQPPALEHDPHSAAGIAAQLAQSKLERREIEENLMQLSQQLGITISNDLFTPAVVRSPRA